MRLSQLLKKYERPPMPGGSSNSDALKLEVFRGTENSNGNGKTKKKKKVADYGYR